MCVCVGSILAGRGERELGGVGREGGGEERKEEAYGLGFVLVPLFDVLDPSRTRTRLLTR